MLSHPGRRPPAGPRTGAALLALVLIPCGTRAATPDFGREVQPLVQQYCLRCHSTEKQKGDIDLEQFTSTADFLRHPKPWEQVVEQLSLGEMPPKDKPQPTDEERQRLLRGVNALLDVAARKHAGDPGPVVLRRLNNAEYTYTIRDLTGVESLDPAKEFPGDSASGEGFMNVGNSLVMSPALLTKYFDAAKEVAAHAVLLPDGIRFSPSTSRRDWTEELLAQIRGIYGDYTDKGVRTSVNLQGIKFDSKDGGVLPLDKYLLATLEIRDALKPGSQGPVPLASGEREKSTHSPESRLSAGNRRHVEPRQDSRTTHPLPGGEGRGEGEGESRIPERLIQSYAAGHQLSPRYLALLWNALHATNSSFLLNPIREQWRAAKTNDVESLAREISRWQHALWKFNAVGHIGKKDGPTSWMEPVTPVQAREELRYKIPADLDQDLTLYLAASDAGDGAAGDNVIFEQPRLVAAGKPAILLRDLRYRHQELAARRERILSKTAGYLAAAAEVESGVTNVTELVRHHQLDPDAFAAWLDYLGLAVAGPVQVDSHFTNTFTNGSGYAFIQGWGPAGTPNLAANSSDQHVRIPGNMKPHSVALHPSPTLDAAVGWQRDHLVPGIPARRATPAAGRRPGRRRQGGQGSAGGESGHPCRRPDLGPDRPARRQSLLRFDGGGSDPDPNRRGRRHLGSGKGRLARRAGRQSPPRPLRERRGLALLHRTRQGGAAAALRARGVAPGKVAVR
jgi:hypothetical protein